MEKGRMRFSLFDPGELEGGCPMHPGRFGRGTDKKGCEAERRAMQAIARTGRPAGYAWRWWWDPRPRVRREVPTGSLHTPRWAYPVAAYKVAVENPRMEAERLNRIAAWLRGENPWTFDSSDRSSRRSRRRQA